MHYVYHSIFFLYFYTRIVIFIVSNMHPKIIYIAFFNLFKYSYIELKNITLLHRFISIYYLN